MPVVGVAIPAFNAERTLAGRLLKRPTDRQRVCSDAGTNPETLEHDIDPYAFYAAVDVFALSSRWEGFPVVLLGAMRAGRPIVSTRVGGIAEAVEHGACGWLCEPGDVESFAAGMATWDGLVRPIDWLSWRSVFGARVLDSPRKMSDLFQSGVTLAHSALSAHRRSATGAQSAVRVR